MNYYQEQQKAFSALNDILDKCIDEKRCINIPSLVYRFSLLYPVSTKRIEKQINLYAETRNLKIENNELMVQ